MGDVQADPVCEGWLDVSKPNKWELLSLIVDTPVTKTARLTLLILLLLLFFVARVFLVLVIIVLIVLVLIVLLLICLRLRLLDFLRDRPRKSKGNQFDICLNCCTVQEEAIILDGLPGIERFGINMVKKVDHKMSKEHMKEVLTRIGEGKYQSLPALPIC